MKEKIVKIFYSDLNLYEIENNLNIPQKVIRKIWREKIGAEAVKNRGKGRNIKTIDKKLLLEFYSTKSLRALQKEYSIDARTIRSHWINTYGKLEVEKRKIYNKNSIFYKKDIIDKIYGAVKSGLSLQQISDKFNIKKRTIQKYVNLDKTIYEQYLRNTSELRSNFMKYQRDSISEEIKQEVLKYFDTDLFIKEIANICSLCSSSIVNVFKEYDVNKYKERVDRLENKRSLKSMKALENAGKLGSKREISFFEQLTDRIKTKIVHHDYDLVPPYEIDITIPELKIAICWDGIGHFKPIFGEKIFKKVVYRDKYKRRHLKKIGWYVFVINDKVPHLTEKHYRKHHVRFDKFLKKIGYGDYIAKIF